MLEINKLDDSHITAIKMISLTEEQVRFAGTAESFLAEVSETVHRYVIEYGAEVVGFFKIDVEYPRKYEFCPEGALGLRAFAIDRSQQGKGIGKGTVGALFPYLKLNYPEHSAVYLTVNCKNPAAISCYEKGGFERTGELYLGGAAGPQHIMRRVLR